MNHALDLSSSIEGELFYLSKQLFIFRNSEKSLLTRIAQLGWKFSIVEELAQLDLGAIYIGL